MKVSFDVQVLLEEQKTGIGRMTEALIREFKNDAEINPTLHFYDFLNSDKKKSVIEQYQKSGFSVKCCKWLHRGIYLRTWKYIPIPYRFIFQEECEISQFFGFDVPPNAKGKKIVFVHDMAYKTCPETVDRGVRRILERNMQNTCKWADCIVTVSEFSKKEIIKYIGVSGNKIKVMPSGVDLELYHPNYNIKEIERTKEKYKIEGNYILYIGTIEPRKNIITLIEAYDSLVKSEKDVPLLVISGKKGWLYDGIFQKVKELNLEEKIIFTGYLEREEAPLLLNGAMMFVFPSIYEGFGLPPLEAMACGTPVIVADAASLPEVVNDAGLKVNPYNPEELSSAMKTFINDPSLRELYSKKGIERASGFTWKHSKDILKGIYKSIL